MKKIAILLCASAISCASFGQSKVITVSNVNEFVKAIAPNTTIQLDPGTYNLSTALDTETAYCSIYGGDILISHVDNLIIQGLGETNVNVFTEDKMVPVLSFDSCKNILVKNLELGRIASEASEDTDAFPYLLFFNQSNDVAVDNCMIGGSGILVIVTNSVKGLTVTNSQFDVISQMED